MTLTPIYSVGDIVKARPSGKAPRLGRIIHVNADGSLDFVSLTFVSRAAGNHPNPHTDVGKIRTLGPDALEPATLREKTTVEMYEESDANRARLAQRAAIIPKRARKGRRR